MDELIRRKVGPSHIGSPGLSESAILWHRLTLDLFAASRNHCLPLSCSQALDPLAWGNRRLAARLVPLGPLRLSILQHGQGSAEQVLGSLQCYDNSHGPVLAHEGIVPGPATVVGGLSKTPPKNRVYSDNLTLRDTKWLSALALMGFSLSRSLSEHKDFQDTLQRRLLDAGVDFLAMSSRLSGRFSEAGVSDSMSLFLKHL